ncbi:MAG: hypothetical protein NC201_08005 [Prevotella sp.]|nr:hypothetical protein [Prevotella sp.]
MLYNVDNHLDRVVGRIPFTHHSHSGFNVFHHLDIMQNVDGQQAINAFIAT